MRDTVDRKKDVLAVLDKQGDYFVSTADSAGRPHVIAVSAWWDGSDLVMATIATSRTARNLAAGGRVTLAAGVPSDAVVIQARMTESVAAADAPALADGFKAAVGWDPRQMEGWAFYRLKPVRIQAFRGYDEIGNRDVMLASKWLA